MTIDKRELYVMRSVRMEVFPSISINNLQFASTI